MSSRSLRPINSWTKQSEVVKRLTRLARKLGPNGKFPKILELTKALGTTKVTLDHGLRQLEEKGLIVRQGRRGIFVSPQVMQKRVGLVMGIDVSSGGLSSMFFVLLIHHCKARAEGHRFSFFLDSSPKPGGGMLFHDDLEEALDLGKLDGIIMSAAHSGAHQKSLQARGLPFVSLSSTPNQDSVCLDRLALLQMAAEELGRRGCREIGLIGVDAGEEACFRELSSQLNFRYDEDWIDYPASGKPRGAYTSYEEFGSRSAELLLSRRTDKRPLPKGLIFTNDLMARGACTVFAEAGLRPGKDLQIASHSNKGSATLAQWENDIIRCEFDPSAIADALFSVLEQKMEGVRAGSPPVVLSPTVVCGG